MKLRAMDRLYATAAATRKSSTRGRAVLYMIRSSLLMERSCHRPLFGLILCIGGAATSAGALEESTPPAPALPEVLVIATTPLPGTRIDADKAPINIQTLSAADLRATAGQRHRRPRDQLASVNIDDNLDDAFQPDILFAASRPRRCWDAAGRGGLPERRADQRGLRRDGELGPDPRHGDPPARRDGRQSGLRP